jgi:hypothetical protein
MNDTARERDFDAFAKVVRTRRSVCACQPEPVPVAVMDACIDPALLAPTSHNPGITGAGVPRAAPFTEFASSGNNTSCMSAQHTDRVRFL